MHILYLFSGMFDLIIILPLVIVSLEALLPLLVWASLLTSLGISFWKFKILCCEVKFKFVQVCCSKSLCFLLYIPQLAKVPAC